MVPSDGDDPAGGERRLVVVTGKGGVGKTTVAAALALGAARSGRHVVLAEVARRDDASRILGAGPAEPFRERIVAERLVHVTIDAERALEEYLVDQLPVRALADVLSQSRAFGYLTAATPGFAELLTVGKVWELAQPQRRTPGSTPHDLVVLDAPATGHGLALLRAPRTFADAAHVGPIARQGRTIDAMVTDPRRTAVVVVATPEELPVGEALALRDGVRDLMGAAPALAVVNAVRPVRLRGEEPRTVAGALAGDGLSTGGRAAVRTADRVERGARAQRGHVQRLRRGLAGDGVPVVTLPFRPGGASDPAGVGALATELSHRLDRAGVVL